MASGQLTSGKPASLKQAWTGRSVASAGVPSPPLCLPIAFPGVADVRVMDAVLVGLLVEEVKHVLDG